MLCSRSRWTSQHLQRPFLSVGLNLSLPHTGGWVHRPHGVILQRQRMRRVRYSDRKPLVIACIGARGIPSISQEDVGCRARAFNDQLGGVLRVVSVDGFWCDVRSALPWAGERTDDSRVKTGEMNEDTYVAQ